MQEHLQALNAGFQAVVIGGFLALVAFGGLVGYHWPDRGASRTYDLVQVDGAESDVIDYDQSATDCGLKARDLARVGIVAFCEVVR